MADVGRTGRKKKELGRSTARHDFGVSTDTAEMRRSTCSSGARGSPSMSPTAIFGTLRPSVKVPFFHTLDCSVASP